MSKYILILFSIICIQQISAESVNFSADVTSGYGHVTVTFTNTSVGVFDSFFWSTPGNYQSYTSMQDFVYTYTRPGIYDVSLSARSSTTGQFYNLDKKKYIVIYPTQLSPYELTSNDVTINSDGYITACHISDFNTSMYHEGNLKIPSIINGQTIKGIADTNYGVFGSKKIVKLSLPNTLEYIGKYAFAANYIQELTIPNGVKTIGMESFAGNDIRVLKISPSVERIEDYAFRNQNGFTFTGSISETQITFIDSSGVADIKQSKLKYIGNRAFAQSGIRGGNSGIIEKVNVTGLFIPPSVEEIGSYAFWQHYIQHLAFSDGSLTCPKSKLRILHEGAFKGFDFGSVISTVIIPASIEIIKNKALVDIVYPPAGGKIIFENNSSLYYIEEMAYGGNSNINTPVILPTQVAANNTPGLWVNMNTGDFISAQTDGTYKLSYGDSKTWMAAYVIDFVDYDGAVLKKDTVIYGNGATAPSDPSITGFYFTGWDTDFSNITNNLTITAQYTVISGTEDIYNESSIKIYPNPVKDNLVIEINDLKLIQNANKGIYVINSLGEIVYYSPFINTKQTINLSRLSIGVYFITIGCECRKIIKK